MNDNLTVNYLFSEDGTYEYELAICGIYKNEESLLLEWVEHHMLLGFTKFYLLDDNSNNCSYQDIKQYIDINLIEYYKDSDISNKDHDSIKDEVKEYTDKQYKFYNKTLEKAKKDKVKWLAYLDVDEFVYLDTEDNLSCLLKNFTSKKICGVCLFFKVFGHNNVILEKGELHIDKLNKRCDYNDPNVTYRAFQMKSIISQNM